MTIQTLTDKEIRFLNELETVDPEKSIWGLAISNVVKNPEVHLVRRLICDLLSQAHDCPVIMQDILGQQCFDNLLSLRHDRRKFEVDRK